MDALMRRRGMMVQPLTLNWQIADVVGTGERALVFPVTHNTSKGWVLTVEALGTVETSGNLLYFDAAMVKNEIVSVGRVYSNVRITHYLNVYSDRVRIQLAANQLFETGMTYRMNFAEFDIPDE